MERGEEKVTPERVQTMWDALGEGVEVEDISARAEAIRARLTVQLAERIAQARAAERDKLSQELAEALGVSAQDAPAYGWTTLISMVLGVRAIGDLVLGTAAPDVDPERRRELLVSFGAAEFWARVGETVERDGAQFRQMLGLDDRGRPMGAPPDGPVPDRP